MKELLDKRAKLIADVRGIFETAERGGRNLLSDEQEKNDRMDKEIDALTKEIDGRRSTERHKQRRSEYDAMLADQGGRQLPALTPGTLPAESINPSTPAAQRILELQLRNQKLSFQAGTPEHSRGQDGYRATYGRYLMSGGDGEQLGLIVAKDTKGGYLAPVTMVAALIKFLDDFVFMRQISNVLPVMSSAVNIGVPSWDTDPGDADWTAEVPASDIAEDDGATLGKREFMPNLLTKLVKVSKKLLRTAVIDPETLLAKRLGYKFGITEEKGFLLGTGQQQALGVFVADANGISTGRDISCASQTVFTADELLDCKFNLKGPYQQRSTWVLHRDTVKRARKLKDGNGQYLWAPGLGSTMPDTLLDRPYCMSEYAPNTFTTGKYVAIIGDFQTGYWIADTLNLEIQRLGELLALRNQIGFLASKETDGAPVLEECFSRLKLA